MGDGRNLAYIDRPRGHGIRSPGSRRESRGEARGGKDPRGEGYRARVDNVSRVFFLAEFQTPPRVGVGPMLSTLASGVCYNGELISEKITVTSELNSN